MPSRTPSPCTPGFGPPAEYPRCIDINLGCSIREHPEAGKLAMYKDTPGVYLNMFGAEVSEKIAREAGFEVDAHRRARLRSEKLSEAQALIEQDLSQPAQPTATKVAERGGFSLIDVGFSRYVIETSEGDRVTPKAVTLSVAQSLMQKLAPEATVAA